MLRLNTLTHVTNLTHEAIMCSRHYRCTHNTCLGHSETSSLTWITISNFLTTYQKHTRGHFVPYNTKPATKIEPNNLAAKPYKCILVPPHCGMILYPLHIPRSYHCIMEINKSYRTKITHQHTMCTCNNTENVINKCERQRPRNQCIQGPLYNFSGSISPGAVCITS